jgi:hypothetical protein
MLMEEKNLERQEGNFAGDIGDFWCFLAGKSW